MIGFEISAKLVPALPHEHTPSYEGTRTPSPTLPPFKETKIVCAEAEDATAATTRGVKSFITNRLDSCVWNACLAAAAAAQVRADCLHLI